MGRVSVCQTSSTGGDLNPTDDGYDCVNKPRYGCVESVYRAGARCSECRVSPTECSVIHQGIDEC